MRHPAPRSSCVRPYQSSGLSGYSSYTPLSRFGSPWSAWARSGGLQVRHVNSLRGAPKHTVAWISSLTGRGGALDAGGADEDAGVAAAEDTGTDGPSSVSADDAVAAPSEPNAFQKYARINVAGIVSTVLGVVALLCLLLPWVGIYVQVSGQSEIVGATLTSAGEELEGGNVGASFAGLLVIGVLVVASIVVPRIATAFLAIAGIAVVMFSYASLYAAFGGAQSVPGASAVLIPHVGWVLAILCYGLVFLLQLIPPWNRRKT